MRVTVKERKARRKKEEIKEINKNKAVTSEINFYSMLTLKCGLHSNSRKKLHHQKTTIYRPTS
jgi:hypothetical protein